MKKKTSEFVCQECGGNSAKWVGKCPDCGAWNSMVEESVVARETSTWTGLTQNQAVSLADTAGAADQPRTLTGIPEFDRVLGGGIVDGSSSLISWRSRERKFCMYLVRNRKIKFVYAHPDWKFKGKIFSFTPKPAWNEFSAKRKKFVRLL
jgi:hypothetical protein